MKFPFFTETWKCDFFKKEIYFDYRDLANGSCLIIRDSGRGIGADQISKVFDPFYTTKDFEDHNGLGLAFSLKSAKLMNIKLKILSQELKGTEIHLEFINTNDNTTTLCQNTLRQITEESEPKVEL